MRTKAFTLLEMLVVMALTGIAVMIALFVLYQFSVFAKDFRDKSNRTQETGWMDLHLRRDLEAFPSLSQSEQSLKMVGKEDSVRWEFRDTYTLRSTQTTDTFHLAIEKVDLSATRNLQVLRLSLADSSFRSPLQYKVYPEASARE